MTMYRRYLSESRTWGARPGSRSLFILLVALGLVGGCASAPQAQVEDPASSACSGQAQGSVDPSALLDTYAQWLPADTIMVAAADVGALVELLRGGFPAAAFGGDTHFEAMREQLGAVVKNELGADLGQGDVLLLAATPAGPVLIVQGDGAGQAAAQAPAAGGYVAQPFEVQLTGVKPGSAQTLSTWRVALPQTNAVAIFIDPDQAEQALQAQRASDGTLKSSPALANFRQLLSEVPTTNLAVAAVLPEDYQSIFGADFGFNLPERMLYNLGGESWKLTAHGSAESLAGLEALVTGVRDEFAQDWKSTYSHAYASLDYSRMGSTIFYHLGMSFLDGLRIERGEGTLSVELPWPRAHRELLIGAAAAMTVPALQKYVMNTKAREALRVARQLEASSIAYYEASGKDGACRFPEPAFPVPAGEPCCDKVGPRNGVKWAPAPETWTQPGWVALDFALVEPTFFAYQTFTSTDEQGRDLFTVHAFADFKPGGERHTVIIRAVGTRSDAGQCQARSAGLVVVNELE